MEKVQYAIEIVNKWGQPLAMFESKVNALGSKKIDPFSSSTASIHKGNSALRETTSNLDIITAKQSTAIEKTMNWGTALKAVAGSYLAMQVGRAVWNWTQDAVMAAAQVEKYNITLKTMLGSTGAARDRMQEYFDIAKKTPFQLNEVVEAGNKLQAIGRYSAENLTNLGDLAAASGKPMEQVMSAYSKLATGQKGEAINMFRDLLISTEDWVKATGKGTKANGELLATTEEMIAALPGILKAKGFLGMMEAQSKSTDGKMSNLKDTIFQLSEAMGNRLKPTTDSYLDVANKMVSTVKEWVEIPTPVKIAQEKAELNALVGVITDANTEEETRSDLLKQLQSQYPEFLANIDLETVKNEELKKRLEEVNKQYDRKIQLAAAQTTANKAQEQYQNTQTKLLNVNTAIEAEKVMQKLFPGIRSSLNANSKPGDYDYVGENISVSALVSLLEDEVKRLTKPQTGMQFDYSKQIAAYTDYIANANIYLDTKKVWSSLENEKATLEAQLIAERKVLSIYDSKVTGLERGDLLAQAQAMDLTNETTYDKLFGSKKLPGTGALKSEFDNIRSKAFDDIAETEWVRLWDYIQGNLRLSTAGGGGGGGGTTRELQKAEDLINGGGRNTKIYNIYLDSLIASNTNVFEPGQDPASAEEFITQLTNALQLVVNDTQMSE